jgi:GT2 family glycosyltransferase
MSPINNSLDKKLDTIRSSESSSKKIVGYVAHTLRHPLRFIYMLFAIKKCNLKIGSYKMDTRFLKYGKLDFVKYDNPKVSIIIPVYNQLDFTYKCLKSILDNNKDVTYEIIIADDVSNDGTEFLGNFVKNIEIVRNKENLRFLRNCNNAAKYAKGEYIVFLNNDTLVKEKWLSSMLDLIEKDKTIGMVGSKLVYPGEMLQEAGGIIFQDGSGDNYGKFLDPNMPEFNYVRDVGYISGASIMLSMKLWKEIGGFDKRFIPAYCEDSDLAFEVRKRGLRVVYQPKSGIVHFEGVSNGSDVSDTNSVKHYQVVNCKKLRDKWKKELEDMPPKYLNPMNIRYRDNLKNKKVILVIDHYVPEFDKDAGSKTTFQYLKMFVEKGYLVKFMPDNFYENPPYGEKLEQMGIEVLYGIQYAKYKFNWIYENRDNIDVIYLNRPEITAKYIDFIHEYTNIKTIYYGHDLHFLREKREYELNGDKKHLELSKEFEEKEFNIMNKVDVVYYPSYVEKELINKINPKINVKAINAYIFDDVDTKTKINFESKKNIMFIGGFVHRPNVDAVLWFAKEIFPKIYKELGITFYIVGSNPPEEVKKLENIPGIIVKGYVTEEELDAIYNECKMSVIPLRYGAGIKGKVVESMSKGIPFVTTSCGAEGIVGIDKIIPVSDTSDEFADSVISLYKDNNQLSNISLKEREYINKNFSTEAAYKIIEEDFNVKK